MSLFWIIQRKKKPIVLHLKQKSLKYQIIILIFCLKKMIYQHWRPQIYLFMIKIIPEHQQ